MSSELVALPCPPERRAAIARTVQRYVALEQAIHAAHVPVCAPTCAKCVKICCAHRFCAEAIESPWLRLAWQATGHTEDEFHPEQGWLRRTGCSLRAGRPPVCYAFLCSQILDPMRDQAEREFHLDQASLITAVGRRAYGQRALVELTREEIATHLNLDRLERAIDAGWRALSATAPATPA